MSCLSITSDRHLIDWLADHLPELGMEDIRSIAIVLLRTR
jgi:hypothetical protein